MSDKQAELETLVRRQLELLGEDPERDGLKNTPLRVAKSLQFLTEGYEQCPKRVLNDAMFDVKSDEMVIVRDIDFYSLCEHHMAPFFGVGHIAYLPTRRIVGLSKLPRTLDMFARRLQNQERITQQVAEYLMEKLQPAGVAVVLTARHMCMEMRGVRKAGAATTTSAMRGRFKSEVNTRQEFLNLLK